MKKTLTIFILLVLTGGGIYVYTYFFQQGPHTLWSFVPSDAVFVYESDNPLKQWEESKEKKIWKNLANLPAFENTNKQLDILDSIAGKNGSLLSFFEDNKTLLSFHVVSRNSIDALYCIEVNKLEHHDMVSKAIAHYTKNHGLRENQRQYLGYTITELKSESENFSYIFYKNFFIGSFTSYLVEDAIRVIEDQEVLSFQEQYAPIFGITRLEMDQGNIFFNTESLDKLAGIFTDPLKVDTSPLAALTELSFLDLSINNDNMLLTGFSLNNPLKANYLDVFNEVGSSEFRMNEIVPNNTAALVHFSFDNAEKWHSGLKNHWRKANPSFLANMGEVENKYDVSIADLYIFLDTELGLVFMESINPDAPDMVACLKLSNRAAANQFFQTLSDATLDENDPYSESWADIPIRHIEVDELPARLFGPIFSGFPSTFYCLKNDFLFLGNNEHVLKQMIDQINSEGTWRKSVKVNNFLDIANKEANLSLFVNTQGSWNMITSKLNQKWSDFFNEFDFLLKQIEFGAFQFSNVDGKYYTSISLQHPGNIVEKVEAAEFEVLQELEFPSAIITPPMVVKNHNDGSLEVMVQDSLNNIHLISSDLDTLWKKALDNPITSDVSQLDYYKNSKLQGLFTTEKSIHLLDRTGEYLPGYPFSLPNEKGIQFLSLIDYDNSRNYRTMAATDDGQYYLYDKGGANLEGWTPKNLEGTPVMYPFHLRVRTKDYMIFMHKNGLVYVLNRRGEPVPGFPIDLKGTVENPLFIQKAGNISGTRFTTVTNDGEIVQFNLEGKFLKREQLYKATPRDQFKLVVSAPNQRTFLVLRSDGEKVTTIDPDGKELFVHKFGTNQLNAKYYNFSPDNEVIVITDKDKDYTYLYNKDGRLLHSLPLETGQEIAMLYYESQGMYKIYKTHGNKLSILKLQK